MLLFLAVGGVSVEGCQPCLPGRYCADVGLSSPSGPCDPGFYCTQGSATAAPWGNNTTGGWPCGATRTAEDTSVPANARLTFFCCYLALPACLRGLHTTVPDKQQPIKVYCFGRRGYSIRRPHVPWRCVSRRPLLSQRQREAAAVPARYAFAAFRQISATTAEGSMISATLLPRSSYSSDQFISAL